MKRTGGFVLAVMVAFIGSLCVSCGRGPERIEELEQQIAVYVLEVESLERQFTPLSSSLDKLLQKAEALEERVVDLEDQSGRPSEISPATESLLLRIETLEERVVDLENQSDLSLGIAYLDTEMAFTVLTDAVQDLRRRALDKQKEQLELQQQYLAGTVSKEEYESRQTELEVEILQAQLNIDIGTIDRMIASPGFADIRHDLERLREEAQPVIDMMRNLVSTVRVGVLNPQEIENRYTQVKNAFSQLDQLLTQAATAKIVQAAETIAVRNGYDLVLRTKNVIIYRNAARLVDITDLVKAELAAYL